ncbi:MAG: hypothetical protein GC129_05200 [Proteobacteria bacterium]|nr:hypothetical protein [Pseudomonadota bacterium]
MARVNWKWVLVENARKPERIAALWAPRTLNYSHVDVQANTACLWAEVDDRDKMRWWRVAVVGTGDAVPVDAEVKLGVAVLTHHGRTRPTPVDNSVQHLYLIDESAEAAALALDLPVLGPEEVNLAKVVPLHFERQVA